MALSMLIIVSLFAVMLTLYTVGTIVDYCVSRLTDTLRNVFAQSKNYTSVTISTRNEAILYARNCIEAYDAYLQIDSRKAHNFLVAAFNTAENLSLSIRGYSDVLFARDSIVKTLDELSK
jgi:hypothetical protein